MCQEAVRQVLVLCVEYVQTNEQLSDVGRTSDTSGLLPCDCQDGYDDGQ